LPSQVILVIMLAAALIVLRLLLRRRRRARKLRKAARRRARTHYVVNYKIKGKGRTGPARICGEPGCGLPVPVCRKNKAAAERATGLLGKKGG
jgi:hypothetical protein